MLKCRIAVLNVLLYIAPSFFPQGNQWIYNNFSVVLYKIFIVTFTSLGFESLLIGQRPPMNSGNYEGNLSVSQCVLLSFNDMVFVTCRNMF